MNDLVPHWATRLAEGSSLAAVLIGVGALLLVLGDRTWRLLRNVVTIAHEGGHAVVALLSGRKLNGIRLHSDTSGLTVSTGKASGPGMVCTLLAGYPTVSLLGLAGAWLVRIDQERVMLWLSIGLLGAMLLAIRNAYGVLSVLITGGVVFAVSWFTEPAVQALCCVLFSWLLLFGGIRPLAELGRKRRRGRAPDSDADQLARLTGVPATVWMLAWLLVGLGALVLSARWLLLVPQV